MNEHGHHPSLQTILSIWTGHHVFTTGVNVCSVLGSDILSSSNTARKDGCLSFIDSLSF